MKVIIHAGMHKTGSTSIQHHFQATTYPGLTYMHVRGDKSNNHKLFKLLFMDPNDLADDPSFKFLDAELFANLPEVRKQWLASLTNSMNNLESNTLLYSAEAISGMRYRKANLRMAEFFRRWTGDVTVMAYVRGPLSYAISSFQQRLKGRLVRDLNVSKLVPRYRAGFSQLDDAYGAASVILRPYARKLLVGGDVVRDFAAFLGVTMQAPPQAEANTSLSAEATALLYVQRRLGQGFVDGFPKAMPANNSFVESLRPIGGGKLGFADSLWNPVVAASRADLDWIENRLGQSLPDAPSPGAVAIGSEQDLFDLAVASEEALRTVVPEALHSHDPDPLKRVTATLEALRQHCYELALKPTAPVAKAASL